MAEEQKPVDVPQEAAPAAETAAPAAEPAAEPQTEEAPAETAAPAESSEAPEAAEAAPAAEEPAKKEVVPIEEGHLEHKTSNFPKNFIYSKKFFWFGSDPVESKKLASYLKTEKAADIAHHVVSWASETGKGLLFYSEKSTDKTPQGVIQLTGASEPATEGTNKFSITSKGHKHIFKASSAAERDNWVSQIKIKIAEAQELATSVTESEAYKKTLESFKPAPVAKKEEKKEDKPAEAAPVAAPEAAAAAAEPAEEAKKDAKTEEPKRRSASRKRASVFGNIFGKKDAPEKAEAPADTKATEPEVPAEAAAASTETPAVAAEAAPATETSEAPAAPVEAAKPEETKAEAKEAKPAAAKRSSVFGGFSFGKKKPAAEHEAAQSAPSKDASTETPAVSDAAPVIPAVETSEPLSAEVSSPANVPAEAVEAKPVTNGETKKEVKSEKRKSSLPFNFGGKKEKALSSDEETEKSKPSSPFAKIRQTIRGRGKATEKSAEKPTEKAEEPAAEAESSQAAEPAAEEAPKAEEPAAPAPVEDAPVEQPIATSTPTVAATA